MVNKTKFYKTKVALAVVLSLGLAACGDSDGDVATSNNTADASQPTEVNQVAKGSIQGVVLDTNGQPVVGATITTAGKTATTDASGSYIFADLPVSNVAGADANTTNNAFTIVIQSPAGYASTATVEVTPSAQIDAANGGTQSGASDIPLTTFIDGFLATAPTAVMPKMESVVEGWIRDEVTGEAIAGAVLSLDFDVINATTNSVAIANNATISGDMLSATTDADGHYRFENVYNDSDYFLSIEGYNFKVGGAQTETTARVTTAEGVVINTGDLEVKAITSADDIKPFVANVTGWIEDSATAGEQYGMLNRGVDQTFTIWFSEPVNAATFNSDDVLVTLSNKTYLSTDTVTLATDGKSMTVVLTEALDEGAKISIFVPWADATDVAGNFFDVAENDAAPGGNGLGIDFDYKTPATSGKATYLKVNLCTFIEPSTGSGVATQVVDEVTGTDGGSSLLAAYSNAYVDSREDSGDSIVQQINGSDSAERLSVFRAIQGNTSTSESFTAVGGETTITLSDAPVGILSYKVNGTETAVTSILGNVITVPALAPADVAVTQYVTSTYDDRATRATVVFEGSATATASGYSSGTSVTSAATVASTSAPSTHYFDFDGVDHNDKTQIVYTDDLGVETKTELVTFTDQAKPTTVIQDDYDLHGYNNNGTYTATVTANGQAQYGNGGETSHAGINDIPGNPTLYVQPRHLAQKGTNGAAPVRGTEFDELVSDMSNRLGAGESPAAAGANESTLSRFSTNEPTLSAPLYDAAAYASWTVGQDIGVAFSEVIALATGAPTYTGTETLTGFAAENSVTDDVDGNTNVILANGTGVIEIEPDLVLFTTSDVVSLANNDNGAILGFAGAVSDARGNVADVDSNAQVVLLDAMPPMVTSALWTGTDLVVTFNEPVTLHATNASNLQVWDPTDSTATSGAIGVTTANGTLSADSKTLTVALSTVQANSISTKFNDGAANEFLYEDNSSSTGEENHAVLAWDGVNDANGNDWDQFNNAVDGTYTNRFETRAPRFLMVNGVGTFTYNVATAGYLDNVGGNDGDDDGAVTYTITFTHPIDLTSPADVVVNGALTATALGTAIDTAEGGAGWSAPGGAAVGQPGVQSTLTWNTVAAADTAIINAIFSVDDIGIADSAADTADAATFTTAAAANSTANAIVTISADLRTITLNVTAQAEGIDFGRTDFFFNTVVDSALINGAQTSAGRFNWQNTN
jgi:hypothetical protein